MPLRLLGAVVVHLLAVAGCSTDGRTGEPAAVRAGAAVVTCGESIQAAVAAASPVALLDGAFPPAVGRGEATFSGTVTLTARQALAGVTSPHPDVFVVRDGTVVAVPLPKDAVGATIDLPAGGTRSFEAVGSTAGCGAPGQPLPTGRYEVYALVTVTGDAGPGSEVVAMGGPWAVEIV